MDDTNRAGLSSTHSNANIGLVLVQSPSDGSFLITAELQPRLRSHVSSVQV